MHQHEVPIEIPCSMNRDEVQKAMTYGAHASAVKYNNFLRRELEEKIRAGHVAIFILTDMQQLLVLCLTPISETYQTGRNPILLYIYFWIRLNKQVKQSASKETIWFEQASHHLLYCIVEADPALGLAYISKIYLTDVHIWIWLRLTDIPSVELFLPNYTEEKSQVVDFHLSIAIGYVEFFFIYCGHINFKGPGQQNHSSMRSCTSPSYVTVRR